MAADPPFTGDSIEGDGVTFRRGGEGAEGVPMSAPMPLRSFRVPDSVWLPAVEAAKSRGEVLSEVLRKTLSTLRQAPEG